jgi:Cu(I)/Ag(I) efflux system membrane protein CusA/SilA
MGGALTLTALRDAVTEGALLRLRPKVMTVSTVVAGLLPIMWSSQVGAEVMKPLATPVLGGMVSSLLHVLIVTPVIFFWIRQRQLGLAAPASAPSPTRRNWRWIAAGVIAVAIVAALAWLLRGGLGVREQPSGSSVSRDVVRTVRAGDLDIVLSSPAGVLRQGRNTFTIEFRASGTGALVDAGTARASANMSMPGMVMTSAMEVVPTSVPGRYAGTAEFGMAGTWRMAIEWDGPAGRGSVSFEGTVQ